MQWSISTHADLLTAIHHFHQLRTLACSLGKAMRNHNPHRDHSRFLDWTQSSRLCDGVNARGRQRFYVTCRADWLRPYWGKCYFMHYGREWERKDWVLVMKKEDERNERLAESGNEDARNSINNYSKRIQFLLQWEDIYSVPVYRRDNLISCNLT